jgi:hypothetical protein
MAIYDKAGFIYGQRQIPTCATFERFITIVWRICEKTSAPGLTILTNPLYRGRFVHSFIMEKFDGKI